ncbi:MAG: glycosyltransferase family A protein [Verrucomicrobiota bacterium]
MRPLVSVIIPCHNAASFVGEALVSVMNQTWSSIEIIVVDDGSTDESSAILKDYTIHGVHLITEVCGSAAKARNRGFQEAKGDYIKFFDADDLLSPDHISLQVEQLSGRMDAVASAEWGRFYDGDLDSFKLNPEDTWRDMESSEWLIEAWRKARPMMQPGIFLIPRPVLESAGGWDEELTLIDDFDFFSRVLCHANEVLFTPGAILYYRSGISGSLSGRNNRQAVESAFHSLMRGTNHLLARRSDKQARLACANILQDFIYTYYPHHSDLTVQMSARIQELGGSCLEADGPPGFHRLRKLIGWKASRRVQRLMRR